MITKNYVARDYITLGNGFRYSATPGQSFRARIDKTITITVPDGTQILPDGTQIKPDGTIIKPDRTQIKPDGTIITPEGTIYKTNGTIINPDGTLLDISLIVPVVWFKTIQETDDINGRYKWKDFSPNNVPLVKYLQSTEYTVGRDSVMNYNFNPAIDLSAGNISKEIIIGTSNLAQATIIGAWGTKKEVNNTDKFIFALNGRVNESIVFSKSNVFASVESGKNSLPYGNDTLKNLLCQPNSTTSAKKARESSMRVASYYKSNKPNTTLWGEQQNAIISLGSSFLSSNTNNTSTFNSTLNNFQGFKGYTPELLIFGKVLQPVERSIFESYLAIKYGVNMEKSYLSGKGKVIWDYCSNVTYNNRITGYGREDLLSLNQKMATTSYQEAPYYSDSCDSYFANNRNNLSSDNRLLVMGCQPETPMNDGQYVLFGDDNNPITAINTSMPGYTTMQRKWMVNTNSISKNWIELSYHDSLATGFASHTSDAYLIIDRSGTGEFNSLSDKFLPDSIDVSRSKIIFKNIVWSTVSKNVFTFGYQTPPPLNKTKKNSDTVESDVEKPTLSIYYKNLKDLSTVTVKLKLTKPSVSNVFMYDLMGRLIYKQELAASETMQTLDIKLPNSGVYVVKAITSDGELSTKVMAKIGH
ncbi:MAG: T9SS type A sorting domain-containing protein [Bacteroidota bacterium]|nr:T9SS type A sorting domain-containing protein [Bacteroidota bacterium]